MVTIGLDLGDRYTHACVLDDAGEVTERARFRTTPAGLEAWFAGQAPCRVVIETGAHTRWIAEKLQQLGHELIVANARSVRLIYGGTRKNDRFDAEALARLGRLDPKLLNPVTLRSRDAQADRSILLARAQLVETRTKLINCVRGMAKSSGKRLPRCDAAAFHRKMISMLPDELRPALEPMVETLAAVDTQIKHYDRLIEVKAEQYDEVRPLLTVHGVGPITAMAFILTLEDPSRFERSRDVGPFLGLVPAQRQSGDSDPELGITKAGDPYLRRLLVQCAHYIIGPFGQDSDLRRFGLRIIERSGSTPRRDKPRTSPKKRAAIAVARKLAVLLHRLWVTGEDWKAFHSDTAARAA